MCYDTIFREVSCASCLLEHAEHGSLSECVSSETSCIFGQHAVPVMFNERPRQGLTTLTRQVKSVETIDVSQVLKGTKQRVWKVIGGYAS